MADEHRYHRAQDLRSANDTVAFAAAAVRPGSRVLDIGAADGSVAAVLTAADCEVIGVEPDPTAAALARAVCQRVIEAPIDRLRADELDGPYDAVLVLDVLEHLRDPVAVLQMLRPLLAEHGRLVVSVPNATHGDVRLALLDNRFDYRDLGLLDRTHLRFFDHDGFRTLLADAGFVVVDEGAVWRELGQTELGVGEVLARHPELVDHLHADPDATTYQFLAIAVPDGSPLAGRPAEPAVRLRSHAAALEREVQHLRAQLAATDPDPGT